MRNIFEIAVKRALMLKARLGVLSTDRKLYATGNLDLDCPEYRKTSYNLACQSIVLLKNNNVLPLSGKYRKIALVGPNANTYWCMFRRLYISVYAGILVGRKNRP